MGDTRRKKDGEKEKRRKRYSQLQIKDGKTEERQKERSVMILHERKSNK